MLRKFWQQRRRSPEVILLPAGEPRRHRLVFRRMRQVSTFGAVAGGGLLAVIFGISLGNSAISQINPLYFQGAAVHPRDRGAAIDPNRPTVIPNRYEQLYGFAQGSSARALDCPGCTFALADVPVRTEAAVPYFGSREESARREAREQAEIDQTYERRREEAAVRLAAAEEQVQRYTHYRVSEDEVVRERPVRERPYYARNDVVLSDDEDGSGDDQE